jgi:hypothetical protein
MPRFTCASLIYHTSHLCLISPMRPLHTFAGPACAENSKDGSFYVHCFTLGRSEGAALHGKKLSNDRFRGLEESRPDWRLVEWHYEQCLMAHMRGFSAGMDQSP